MRSANTVLRKVEDYSSDSSYGFVPATYVGVGLKTAYYILMTFVGAILGFYLLNTNESALAILLTGSGILGFIFALLAMNAPKLSLVFGSFYCVLEGLFLGTLSLYLESMVPGVVLTAMVATLAIVLSCAFLFVSGIIKVGSRFKKFLWMASISFMLTMLVLWIMSAFGLVDMSNFGVMILVDFLTCVIATLFLINDFEYARMIVANHGPKELEWMVAFGIAYTVIWLYYEILRVVIHIVARRS